MKIEKVKLERPAFSEWIVGRLELPLRTVSEEVEVFGGAPLTIPVTKIYEYGFVIGYMYRNSVVIWLGFDVPEWLAKLVDTYEEKYKNEITIRIFDDE